MKLCLLSEILQINFYEEYVDDIEAVIVISIKCICDAVSFNDST